MSLLHRSGNARRVLAAVLLASMAAACASAPQVANVPPPVIQPAPVPVPAPFRPDRAPEPVDTGITPPHMRGAPITRAALLLPFSSSSEAARREAASMLNAAELALFERGADSLLIIPKDSGDSQAGGEAAARAALAEGADVILGPLFAQSVTGAANAARTRGVPVIAFSTDRTVAGQGVYLLSFAPEPEVRRAAQYAASRGARSIALLAADNAFGRRVADVLQEVAAQGGPQFFQAAFYQPDNFDQAVLAIENLASARAAGAFDAIYISDNSASLQELSSVLRANFLTAQDLIVLGPDSWRGDPIITTVGALDGAFVTGPDEGEHANFAAAYRAAYDEEPTDLASLAYDAVALAAQMRGNNADYDVIENPNGYLGANGLFRLPPDGLADRGLAVYQLSPTGVFLVESAPARFDAAAF